MAQPLGEQASVATATGPHDAITRDVTLEGGTIPQPTGAYDALDADEPPPRKSRRGLVLAAGAAVVLIAAVAVLQSGGPEPVEPAPPPEPTVVAPPEPDPQVLADVRADLAQAEQEEIDLDFVGALERLNGAATRLAGVIAAFPEHPEVRALADSIGAQVAGVDGRCNSFRSVQIDRNQPPPVCSPEQE